MFKIGDLQVGDKVLSSDTDFLFGNKVEQEWFIIKEITECGTGFQCEAITDGTSCLLFLDEIIEKKPRLKVVV